MRTLQTPPARMVEEGGSINFGSYIRPFRNTNILDAPLYSFPVPRCWKNFRLKEWQHYGIITPTHYIGMVIVDAKFTAVSFVYVYDRLKNTRFEHARQDGKLKMRLAGQLYDDVCLFELAGYHLRFENQLDQGRHRIFIDIDGYENLPAVKGEVTVYEDLGAIEPLVQVSPITRSRPFYTHKVAAPASGRILAGSEEIVLEGNTAVALVDEQKTYYPYVSFWKWSTAAGHSSDGKFLAFNLCQNMIADDEDFNENCFWVDGKITCLKAARFAYGDVMKPWKIKTTDGRLDLSFVPAGERAQKINMAGIIRSDFHQPFGLYNGSFKDDQGVIHPVKDFFGVAEDHMTRY